MLRLVFRGLVVLVFRIGHGGGCVSTAFSTVVYYSRCNRDDQFSFSVVMGSSDDRGENAKDSR